MQPGEPENPFIKILAQLKSQGAQAPGQQQPTPQSALAQAQQAPVPGATGGMQQPEVEDAALPGKNPGVTKNLLGAMSQLHGAITQMTDPKEIQMVRNIIVMLNQLIVKDQEVQNQKTGTMTPAAAGQSNFSAGSEGEPTSPVGQ